MAPSIAQVVLLSLKLVERSLPALATSSRRIILPAGKLPAEYVIHTVGPVWNGGKNNEAEKLAECYWNSLMLAVEHGCSSIAFPNISTGIYGFPKALAAKIAVETVREFLETTKVIEKVIFVCFDEESERVMKRELVK